MKTKIYILMTTSNAGAPVAFSNATKTLAANPHMTYGQAVGYGTGMAARALGDKYAGLSRAEWENATDDYAQGYRKAFISQP